MNFLFHLGQGQHLLEKRDEESILKAIEHFKIANDSTEYNHICKPSILYYLALSFLSIGQIEISYKFAHKAKLRIDTVIENSSLTMNNMRDNIGEREINVIIAYIEEEYAEIKNRVNIFDDIDENKLNCEYPKTNKIKESELVNMSFEELYLLRKECAKKNDIESLLIIAIFRFAKESSALNEDTYPEICYYYGRLRRSDNLNEFIEENAMDLLMLSDSSKELARNLFKIGYRFPFLNDEEILYLEEKYSSSITFELFDIIMFDVEKLSRPVKKFDKNLLKITHSNFSKEFLLNIYSCFLENDKLDEYDDELYTYSRIYNKIIRKSYEKLEYGEFHIIDPIQSNELSTIIKNNYGKDSMIYFAKLLSYDGDLDKFINYTSYMIRATEIENAALRYFSEKNEIDYLKLDVARFWLKNINSKDISFL